MQSFEKLRKNAEYEQRLLYTLVQLRMILGSVTTINVLVVYSNKGEPRALR